LKGKTQADESNIAWRTCAVNSVKNGCKLTLHLDCITLTNRKVNLRRYFCCDKTKLYVMW